jgi:lysophospholipase L1-like esterase
VKLNTILFSILTPTAFASSAPKADVPELRFDKHWLEKHNHLAGRVLQASREAPLDIYFLGDSITELWPVAAKDVWQAEFGKMRVLNCGIGGDNVQNVLYRITHGEFDHISPKVVAVLAGINNLRQSPQLEPDELARGLQRIVTTIRDKSPTSKILLLSIFPSAEPSDPIRRRIVETNKHLATLSDNSSVFYLDISNAFLDSGGNFPATISPDKLHLTAKGYRIWADSMRPTLQKLLEAKTQ